MVKKPTFEKAMKELEDIVLELESGEPPLEKALKKFEDGMRLVKFCSEKLDETERKITLLTENPDGAVTESPFFPADSAENDTD